MTSIFLALLIPFLGTTLGAFLVFFLKEKLNRSAERMLTGFAGGVMIAASIWSLLIPAIENSAHLQKFSFVPAVVGFWVGILFLLLLDHVIPHFHQFANKPEGFHSHLQRSTMLVLAVTLHNIPEGMALGAAQGAWILSIGIAIQNIPEGLIVSMPLKSAGFKSSKAFVYGMLSGIVEPIAGVAMLLLASSISPAMPYLLSFAAGAMIYVVVEELVPSSAAGEHSDLGTLFFALGFSLMLALDVALG